MNGTKGARMKNETMEVMERLETAAATLETALNRIEER